MKPAPQEPITLSWRPIAPPPRRVVDGPLPEPLGHFYRRFDLTRFNRRSMMTDHRQTVFVCSNAKCGAVWDTDPHGHCPACMSNDGVGEDERGQWTCAARKQSLPEPADCNWPFCSCDPYANKVKDALEEARV